MTSANPPRNSYQKNAYEKMSLLRFTSLSIISHHCDNKITLLEDSITLCTNASNIVADINSIKYITCTH